ncbi:hypothetical protein EG028_10770 [Chitinophaga barathri]|uniref:Uncharacterized protein n=1 Tax=Chitinophaga barathri TaxID=1647451 RepID=A0A3N4MNE7_9BACT|nr:hypothetical protein EG028_10770 [Chitinophaga barathri]
MLLCLHLAPLCLKAQEPDLQWLGSWFNAWDLACTQLFRLPPATPPEMVFYDDTYVYTSSAKTAPSGTPIVGPSLYGRKISWLKMPHKDTLILPDGQRVPVGLMSFAAATGDGRSFFVMAAPSFWKAAGVESRELTLEKMLTGVFLHEFAHTRQYPGFGRMVDSVERKNSFGDMQLSDDIVQDYFRKDSAYTRLFLSETGTFYEASDSDETRVLVKKGLAMLKARQEKYFTGNKTVLTELDDVFLSMEGLGQYVAVYWLTHPQGGNMPPAEAVNGFRRKRNQWSQEEGLAMFLALTKLAKPDWLNDQFGEHPKTIVQLLEQAVAEK